MYTLTIHFAPRGTTCIDQLTGKSTPSAAGHMWYSIKEVEGQVSHIAFICNS
jgi:hypothetical protein